MTTEPTPAPRSLTNDPRWTRIVARDKTADGQFWYSVSTTGIYCRPSCPSRAANPANVRLHDSVEDAKATGFRACKRCNPDRPPVETGTAVLVAKACRIIEASEEPPSLKELADAAGRSPGYFHRTFKAATGLTPKAYAAAHRAKKVRQGLACGNSVTATIYEAGFNSSSRFYEKAIDMLGMTPSQYRAGGANEEIRFAVGETSLGAILVASSTKGVASILLGDDPDQLVRNLQDRFPKAHLIGADRDYEALVARVVGFVEAPRIGLNLPLDVRCTAFAATRVAGPAGDSGRRNGVLYRDRAPYRRPESGARRRRCMRGKQPRGRHPLPPRDSQRWRAVRIRLGRRAQARAAGSRTPSRALMDRS